MADKKDDANTIGQRSAKVLAVLLTTVGLIGLYALVHAYNQPAYTSDTSRYVWENVGVICIAVELVLALVLARAQQYMYWFFWFRLAKVDFDERQLYWRQRVLEKSYSFALLLALVGIVVVEPTVSAVSTDERHVLLVKLVWLFGVYFLSLPSVLGAWQERSTKSIK